jgi:hypothetical protein
LKKIQFEQEKIVVQLVSNWKKNPVHQTRYFKLENWKIPVQIGRGNGWANCRKENLRLTIVQFSIFLVFIYLGGQLPTQPSKLLHPVKEQQESLRLLFQRNAHV